MGRKSAICSAAVFLVAPAGTHAAADRCVHPAGAHVGHGNYAAVVYTRGAGAVAEGNTRYWACLRSTGRRTRLPDGRRLDISGLLDTVSTFRLNAAKLAYVYESHDFRYQQGSISVALVDLRTGRQHVSRRELTSSRESVEDPLTATHLILTARGNAAWIETVRTSPDAPLRDFVTKLDSTGRRRTLDVGPVGTLTALHLVNGNSATWTNAAILRHSALDG